MNVNQRKNVNKHARRLSVVVDVNIVAWKRKADSAILEVSRLKKFICFSQSCLNFHDTFQQTNANETIKNTQELTSRIYMADTQVTICDFCCRSSVTSSGRNLTQWLQSFGFFCKHLFACYSFKRAFGDLMLEYYISNYIFLIVCSISYNLLSRCSYFVLIDTKTLGCNITEIIWVIFDKDHFNSSLFFVFTTWVNWLYFC